MEKKLTLQDLLIIAIIPLQIFTHVTSPHISVNLMYVLFFIIIILHIMYGNKLYIFENTKGIYIGFTLCFLVVPTLCFHIRDLSGCIYIALLLMYLLLCDVIGQRLASCRINILMWWAFLSSVILFILVIINIKEINVNTLTSVFKTKEYADSEGTALRYRASLGFSHPNFAGIVCMMIFMLNYIAAQKAKTKKVRNLYVIFLILSIIPVLSTGSRTACLCIVAFIALEIAFKFLLKINDVKIRNLIMFVIVLFVVFVILGINNIDVQKLSDLSSGRVNTIVTGIDGLNDNGYLWFGYIVSNVSEANGSLSAIGIITSDNWYYLQIARFGLVGLLLFMIPIIITMKKILDFAQHRTDMRFVFTGCLTLFLYGFGENVVFNQGAVLSTFVWTLIFYVLALQRLPKRLAYLKE